MWQSHRIIWTLCTAFLNLPVSWQFSTVQRQGGETVKHTHKWQRPDNHQINTVKGGNGVGLIKTRGLLMFLPNTYIDVNSISMPAFLNHDLSSEWKVGTRWEAKSYLLLALLWASSFNNFARQVFLSPFWRLGIEAWRSPRHSAAFYHKHSTLWINKNF